VLMGLMTSNGMTEVMAHSLIRYSSATPALLEGVQDGINCPSLMP